MMRLTTLCGIVFILFCGCTRAHQATKQGGGYIGKTLHTTGGIYEGAAEEIAGPVTDEENPYGR